MQKGKISVLMGVYNCRSTLRQAVESVVNQTYTNWELIICDDGSDDGTAKLARELADTDDRITVLENDNNVGLGKTLNRCFSAADGEFIARMDGDDDCMPQRFMIQVGFLEMHPEYGIVSSPMILFDGANGEWGLTSVTERPRAEDVVCGSPICHAPVMMRRECMESVHGYSEEKRTLRVEDVDLWIRLYAAGYRCYNLREPLYRMRNDGNALKRRKYRYRINSAYVRLSGCRRLHLGTGCYFKALLPLAVGLIPARLRDLIRRRDYGMQKKREAK